MHAGTGDVEVDDIGHTGAGIGALNRRPQRAAARIIGVGDRIGRRDARHAHQQKGHQENTCRAHPFPRGDEVSWCFQRRAGQARAEGRSS